jgi:hypothetical protein
MVILFSFALLACFISGMMMAHRFREWRRDVDLGD